MDQTRHGPGPEPGAEDATIFSISPATDKPREHHRPARTWRYGRYPMPTLPPERCTSCPYAITIDAAAAALDRAARVDVWNNLRRRHAYASVLLWEDACRAADPDEAVAA